MRKRAFVKAGLAAATLLLAPFSASAQDLPHNLLSGKPFAGTKLNILSVVTPQFDGLMLRDGEFTELTGIETEWTFIPFGSLQEKVNAEGIAANGTFDVVNYLDSWGPPNSHWLMRIDELMARDGISMDRYPAAFARSAQFEGETLGFPLRAHPQLMFYRKDLIPEPPASWEEVIAIGKKLKKTNPDVAPLALYFNNDGNRQNLFIWINFLWAAGADIFNDDWTPGWTSEQALKATEDYIALHTTHGVTNPNSLAFVEQDARQSFMQGKSAMIPGLVVGVFRLPQSRHLDPDQGSGRVRRNAVLQGRHKDLCDLDAVFDFGVFRQQGRGMGILEVAVEPRDGQGQCNRAQCRRQVHRQQRRHPHLLPPGCGCERGE